MAGQWTTNPLLWAPSAAAGVSVTPAGTAWANSGWVTVISSSSAGLVLHAVLPEEPGAAALFGIEYEIDIGVGAVGLETVIAQMCGVSASGHEAPMRWPIGIDAVPSSTRVAIRMRKEGTDTTAWQFALGYLEKPITGDYETSARTPVVLPSSQVSVPLGASAGGYANGAWTTIVASPTFDGVIVGIQLSMSANTQRVEVDLGTGASGAEALVYTVKSNLEDLGGGPWFVMFPAPVSCVTTGVRIAGRVRAGAAIGQDVKLLAMPTPL